MAGRQADFRPHKRVAEALRQRIRGGGWRGGQLIPSRRQLAVEHGVALTTIERAVTTLISEGLLRADDRRGTFVQEPHPVAAEQPPAAAGRPVPGPLVGTVGLVARIAQCRTAEDYENQWPLQVLRGCEHQLAAEPGLTVRFCNAYRPAGQSPVPLDEAVDELVGQGAGLVIVVGERPSPAFVARFATAGVQLVFAEYDFVAHPFPQVYADDAAGGALAARHLFDRGYRHLLYFQPFVVDWAAERLAGVKLVLANPDHPEALRVLPAAPVSLAGHAHDQRDLARRRAPELLDANWRPGTGIIAANDSVAAGFIEAAREHGLEAGRDFGIVGFDDRRRDFGLTSLRPPLTELGEEAATLAMRLLRGEPAPTRIALRHRLIARASTAPWQEHAAKEAPAAPPAPLPPQSQPGQQGQQGQ